MTCTFTIIVVFTIYSCVLNIEGTPAELSNNLQLVDEEVNRYASGENSLIVAQYIEPVSSGIPTNPLFYGFFYGFNVSNSLRLITEKYLASSYDNVPEFAKFLDKIMQEANITDPFAYYKKPLDPESGKFDPYFHTTTEFCGRKNCLAYWNKAGKFLGKSFVMHLVGLFFTKRTYGIRVKLTVEEQSIFEEDERSNSMQAVQEPNLKFNISNNIESNFVQKGHEYEGYFKSHKGKVDHPLYPGIHFSPQEPDFHPTESRSHVSRGCAPTVTPEQTGLDLLEIVDLEISGVLYQDWTIGGSDLPTSTLRQFVANNDDDDETEIIFVIYPSEKMVTEATFSVYL